MDGKVKIGAGIKGNSVIHDVLFDELRHILSKVYEIL